ncbi:hypothetical protein DB346_07570 [Verrucomicrobia bacterium LW23]|nr:hypothetical protein DB346_07570 [Verrucomicrobia bacterium LW23]
MQRNNGPEQGKKAFTPRSIRRVLIVCEDTKSSCYYFESFPYNKSLVELKILGTGSNTDSLMTEAIRLKNEAYQHKRPYSKVWVVFDRDSFPKSNYSRAFDLARAHSEVEACWSNECFELWYLLHFQYQNAAIGREAINRKLSKLLGATYNKADKTIYSKLTELQPIALKNAKKLAFEMQHYDNPSTKVHELVDELNSHNQLK